MRSPYEAFGVECGKGWKRLYQPLIDLCNLYGVTVLQIKEKMGGLRFYAAGKRLDEVEQMINAAESRSYKTCEECGECKVLSWDDRGNPVYSTTTEGGWLKTLCQPCREGRKK